MNKKQESNIAVKQQNNAIKHKVPRTIFVHDHFPPFVGGSVTMMYNLSLGLELDNSFAVTQLPVEYTLSSGHDSSISISMASIGIKGIPKMFVRASRWGLPSFFIMGQIPKIVSAIIKSAKKTDAKVIMTCWPNHHFTIAAWIAAKRLKLPLVVYFHSLWVETRKRPLERFVAKHFEKRICRSARKILVATPPTATYLKEKLGVDSGVIEHTINSQVWPLDETIVRTKQNPRKILMLGSVNKFNQDSVIAFSKAVSKIPDLELTILTGQKIEQLEKIGLDTSRITCAFVSRDQLKDTILSADALYLALGFDTPVQKEVEVVIPTRLMDYLASGIPIIAHGPGNTWTIQEAKNKGWGFAIDSLEDELVHHSLEKFLTLPSYNEIVQSSWKEAKRRDYVNQSKLLADYLMQASGKNQ
jgi:glycosyltransferase involved in cell wall biosynthesis